MLNISSLSRLSYIPGIGEPVYAVRRKKWLNVAGRWVQSRDNTDVEVIPVIVDEITFFHPEGTTELAWKGVAYPVIKQAGTFFGQVRICKDNIALTPEEADTLLDKFKKIGLSFNLDDVVYAHESQKSDDEA